MKRTIVGVAILAVLLAGGILASLGLTRHNTRVAGLLDTAAEQALAGQLPEALLTAENARSLWETRWNISAVFTDHDPLEQIDGGFARLGLYGRADDPLAFAAVCVELSRQIEALGDAHGAQWWNIL